MSYEQFRQHIETLRQQFAALQRQQVVAVGEEITAAIEELQLIYEEMQTSVDAADVVESKLIQQNQQLAASYQKYYELFLYSPIAYLVTDTNGLILEANQAIALLLNIPQAYLIGKPLAVYIAKEDRRYFRTLLNQIEQVTDVQVWEINLCGREGQPFLAQLHIAIQSDRSGAIEALRIGVYKETKSEAAVTQLGQRLNSEEVRVEATKPLSKLPQSLDGLQVLIVDDEADTREFIAAVLEPLGIRIRAVASAAAALAELEQFQPDVLVSDIRMPDKDGYTLIRQVREIEAQKGWHIPAAAITAYLDEDREKAIKAGFEAHLHKLAQPTEFIEMVAQLARRRM